MTTTIEKLTFTVPLTRDMLEQAQRFSKQQRDKQKAKQVYLNTISVLAVAYYCELMELETDLEASDSWNIVTQTLMDVADLDVTDIGKLECRPVYPHAEFCRIPQEVWEDRIGFVGVEINEDNLEAKLLGFVKEVNREQILVSQLQSLGELINVLYDVEPEKPLIDLSEWWKGLFTESWISLIYKPALRGTRSQLNETVKAKKEIDYGLLLNRQPVDLVITIKPEDNKAMGVLVQVVPRENGEQNYLPEGLKLRVMLESDIAEAEARSKDKLIQLEFSENVGKSFTVEVILDDAVVTEQFIV